MISPRSLRVIVSCMITLLAAASTRAATEPAQVDQSYLAGVFNGNTVTSYAISSTQTWGQSFTVGRSGYLTQIDLQLARRSTVTAPVTFEIRRMNGAVPNTTPAGLLFTRTLQAADVPGFPPTDYAGTFTTTISLLEQEFPVTIGDTLAIIGSTTSVSPATYNWSGEPTNLYAGGTSLWKPGANPFSAQGDKDSGFQTWVALPEPGALSAIAVGLALAVRRRRR